MNSMDEYYNNLKNQTNNQLGLYLFCCSISVIWTIYVLFFNSRVIGSLATFCLNIYLKQYSKKVCIRIRKLLYFLFLRTLTKIANFMKK